jgi:hypothetical protein
MRRSRRILPCRRPQRQTDMTTNRQILANRANARKSTGPRGNAGKAASRVNARRHGLAAALQTSSSSGDEEVERLARAIADKETAPHMLALARRVGEAEMTVRRLFRARMKISDMTPPDSSLESMLASDPALLAPADRLVGLSPRRDDERVLERYERRAYSRRKTAVREFDLAKRRESEKTYT